LTTLAFWRKILAGKFWRENFGGKTPTEYQFKSLFGGNIWRKKNNLAQKPLKTVENR
jgi:hypothetical protein